MLADLILRRDPPFPRLGSPADGVRVLSHLPARWRAELAVSPAELAIRIRADGGTVRAIREEALRALADPALSHWSLHSCREVRSSPPPWRAGRPGSG